MLILSRKAGQQIVIGGGIVLVVKRITGQRVTVGIEAPRGVHIRRGELELLAPDNEMHDEMQEDHDESHVAVGSPTGAPIKMDMHSTWHMAHGSAKPR